MPKKHPQKLRKVSYTIEDEQAEIIEKEAFARRYDSSSHLAREIFQAWIEEFHKT